MEDDDGTTCHRRQHDRATRWIAVALASCVFFHLEEPRQSCASRSTVAMRTLTYYVLPSKK
jgi:hypothetical protein